MFTVTDRRLEMAKPILDTYAARLVDPGSFDAGELERELRDVWGTGYREIKDAMIALYKHQPEYSRVAEHYMRTHMPEGMMVSEFKNVLDA